MAAGVRCRTGADSPLAAGALAAFAGLAGRGVGARRAGLRDRVLADLADFPDLARVAVARTLRVAGFAAFLAAGALRAAALATGFLDLDFFLPGIKFSAA